MADAGRILIMPKGTYDASTTYELLDLVKHNDMVWLAKKESIGVEPSDDNSEYWFPMADSNASRLGGKTAEEWQEEIDNILNGTTPAGDSNSLGGETAEEWQEKIVNPNLLLINPTFMVNQRGKAQYTNTDGQVIYTVDRWYISGNSSVTVNDGSIIFKSTQKDSLIGQHVYGGLQLADRTLALSCNVKSVSGSCKLRITDGVTTTDADITGSGIVSLTHKVDATPTRITVGVINSNSNDNELSVELEWMKLEIGSVATPFTFPIMADEHIKCLHFFQRQYAVSIVTYTYSALKKMFWGEFAVPMRTQPTVKAISAMAYIGGMPSNTTTISGVTAQNTRAFDFTATWSSGSSLDGSMAQVLYEADAEIY